MKFAKILTAAVSLVAISSAASAFPIAAAGTEGFKVVVSSTDHIIATYQGNSASYSNDLYLQNSGLFIFNNHESVVGSTVDLGSFAIGTELIFRLHVRDNGNDFYTGPSSRNADGGFHARVQSGWALNETLVSFEDLYNGPYDFNDLSFSFTSTVGQPAVPEPASWALMIGGFALAGAGLRHRKAMASFA